jgi:hypothetical protein
MDFVKTNPFDPPLERTPLLLTLDARSLEALSGEALAEAEFLCQLCWTEAVDGLWGWEGRPIVGGIHATELGPLRDNNRVVRTVGEPEGCFIGGVRCWNQFSEWANHCGYQNQERDWFIYYASLNHFHAHSGRHYLVTADERLLKEREEDKGWFRRGQPDTRIRSVAETLFLAGLSMKAHSRVYYEAPQPGHSIYSSKQSIYDILSQDFIEGCGRLAVGMRRNNEHEFRYSERQELIEAIYDRVIDILRGRDRIALANAREQNAEALDEIRYDLRSMVAAIAGAIDTVAVLAQIEFSFDIDSDSRISLRFPPFRRALRNAGAAALATAASEQMPLLHFLWSLRNPILHRQGLPGFTLHVLGPGPNLSQITLSESQLKLLDALCAQRGERAEDWGLQNRDLNGVSPAVEPWLFTQFLASRGIGAIQRLADALADDCHAPKHVNSWVSEQRKAIRRYRLLSGFLAEDR